MNEEIGRFKAVADKRTVSELIAILDQQIKESSKAVIKSAYTAQLSTAGQAGCVIGLGLVLDFLEQTLAD
jgi:hypothetical protein